MLNAVVTAFTALVGGPPSDPSGPSGPTGPRPPTGPSPAPRPPIASIWIIKRHKVRSERIMFSTNLWLVSGVLCYHGFKNEHIYKINLSFNFVYFESDAIRTI